jgi:hypothetical protein
MGDHVQRLRSDALWLCVGLESVGHSVVSHVSWRMLVSVLVLAGGVCVWVAGGPPTVVTDLLGLVPLARERSRAHP